MLACRLDNNIYFYPGNYSLKYACIQKLNPLVYRLDFKIYSRLPNKRTGPNKSIGWNFSQNLIKVQEGDEPNNSIAKEFLTQCNKHIGWGKSIGWNFLAIFNKRIG